LTKIIAVLAVKRRIETKKRIPSAIPIVILLYIGGKYCLLSHRTFFVTIQRPLVSPAGGLPKISSSPCGGRQDGGEIAE
jgi:hypothetical protein